jgi:RNA polymerase sigma-70 factor, ECF subfamily
MQGGRAATPRDVLPMAAGVPAPTFGWSVAPAPSYRARYLPMSVHDASVPDPSAPEPSDPAASADEDVAAIPALYASLRTPLLTSLIASTHDQPMAEDLVQEAFIRLVHEARSGRMPRQPAAWLYRVASNLAITQARKASTFRRIQPRLVGRIGDDDTSPERRVLDREWAEGCAEALAAMPPTTRRVMLLAASGMPGRTIALRVGRSDGATRTLLCRGRARLRDMGVGTFAGSDP